MSEMRIERIHRYWDSATAFAVASGRAGGVGGKTHVFLRWTYRDNTVRWVSVCGLSRQPDVTFRALPDGTAITCGRCLSDMKLTGLSVALALGQLDTVDV